MSKTNVVQIHTADAAFKRVKPLLDQLRDNIQAAAKACGDEYNALPDSEKAAFAEKISKTYGWSQRRLQDFAIVQRKLPAKHKIISTRRAAPNLEDLSMRAAEELVRTDDALLRKAAARGMFDKKVSSNDIRRLRQTGQIPAPKKEAPKTDIEKLMAQIVIATECMDNAALAINRATRIMDETNVHSPRGKEVGKFTRSFEKLCASVATTLPATSKRAFAILRGEV